MPASDTERRLRGQIASNISWANTTDRTARTAPGRRALEARFLAEADGDPKRAENLRRAYFQKLALKSARARRRAREALDEVAAVATELDGADSPGGAA